MNYLEIQTELSNQTKILKDLQSKTSKCVTNIGNLRHQKDMMELEYFVEYLEIGHVHTFSNHVNLRGVPTGKNNFDGTSFSSGEKIEIVKKNKKSIVVKCTKRKKITWQDVNGKRVSVSEIVDYDKLFRIEIESLLYYFTKNEIFNNNFNSWIKRRVSLDSIGI